MSVIECRELEKSFFGKKVLDGLSFTIEENKITGLIGRNGVGKSTLLKIISGFIKETSGEIKVFSKRPFNNLIVSANSIFVDDQMVFPPSMQLHEILEAGALMYPNWDMNLAKRLLDYFSFDPKDYHHTLSKGRTSTFNMIVGLAAHCPLTIFDEPTTGMDEAVRKDFYRALLKDYLNHPRNIILSSHHLNEIEDLLEDILLLKGGKCLLHMSVSELKEWAIAIQGQHQQVKEFLNGRQILFEKRVAPGVMYSVVKNDFSTGDLEQARMDGFIISSVPAHDLCVYLTNDAKGGIDDVFVNG